MSTEVDQDRRRFLTAGVSVVGGAGAAAAAVPFIISMQPSEKAKTAGAPVEVDISKIEPGQRIIVKWRGKPVWIVRRTQEMIDALPSLNDQLADPESDNVDQQPTYVNKINRAIRPDVLVMVGICTHLGCSPSYKPEMGAEGLGADWQGGFFCPCHGSRFDLAGRVYKSVPAPDNMVIPPYRYLSDTLIVIGEDQEVAG